MLRNWILQDLPHVLTQRSLQTLGTASFHTAPTRNRKFWNLFEFSRKNNNRKDVKKSSKQDDSSKKNKLNDSSKNILSLKSSNKVYSTELASNEYTFRYIPRMKPRSKASRSNINKSDDLTSLLDGNLVPTNMKLKLKGYKTLRNAQAKDFAFVPGGKCFELDILPNQNEDGSIGVSYKLSETVTPKKVEKVKKQPPQEINYNDLETNYIPFPIPLSDYSSYTETKDSKKIVKEETNQSQPDPIKNTLKQSETTATIKKDALPEQKETLTPPGGQDQFQVPLESDNNSQTSESLSQKNTQPSAPPITSQNQQPSTNLSNQNQLKPPSPTSSNQPNIQHNLSESHDAAKINQLSSTNTVPDQTGVSKTSHDQPVDPNIKKVDKNNSSEVNEGETKSKDKIPRYGMYESRMEQQRRGSSPCSTSFVKARENSTKQRWSGFDRPATGCCPGSSGSHGTGSQGSTRPYPPIVPTREASSKCYARGERDPIVRSNITKSRKMLKTRNSVTTASIATVNFAEASTRVKGERILLGSKSVTGLAKISQTVAYGSCNKSNSNCNDNNSCSKKRRSGCEDEELIPGKVICTKPRRRNDCSRPKPCRVERPCEKRFTCAEQPPPPRPSCCKPKKKKKVCKRYCCPALQVDDCLLKRHTCPPKRGKKCSNNNEDDDEFDRPDNEECSERVMPKRDPTCLPMKQTQGRNDCSNSNESSNCSPPREFCTNPKRCSKSRSYSRDDRDDDCLENDTEYREICTKPKKKDCCNSRRSSRRSNSCGNRRYHSETRPLRSTKSFVTIPIFDVSVVSLRPYQNDAVLRFYSCRSDRKSPSSCGQKEDPCKKKCQKPEPKCLNRPKSGSVCGEVKEDNCTKIIQKSMRGTQMDDPCGKKKVDPCAQKRQSVCGKPKTDSCGSPKDTREADRARLQKELQEVEKCKGIAKKCKTVEKKCKTEKKKSNLERVVSPCKQNRKKTKGKCDKFESINDSNIFDVDLQASQVKLDDRLISFWVKRDCDSSLLNFGMKPDNIVNRSLCTTRKTDGLQHGDNLELPVLVDADSLDTESSSSEL